MKTKIKGASKNEVRCEESRSETEPRKLSKKPTGVAKALLRGLFAKTDKGAGLSLILQQKIVFRGALKLFSLFCFLCVWCCFSVYAEDLFSDYKIEAQKFFDVIARKDTAQILGLMNERGKNMMQRFDDKSWQSFFLEMKEELGEKPLVQEWKVSKRDGKPIFLGNLRVQDDVIVALIFTLENRKYVFEDIIEVDRDTWSQLPMP